MFFLASWLKVLQLYSVQLVSKYSVQKLSNKFSKNLLKAKEEVTFADDEINKDDLPIYLNNWAHEI